MADPILILLYVSLSMFREGFGIYNKTRVSYVLPVPDALENLTDTERSKR